MKKTVDMVVLAC